MTHMLQPMECSYHTLRERVPGTVLSRFSWKSFRWIDDEQFCENPTTCLWLANATGCRSIRRFPDKQIATSWNWISSRPTGNRLTISQGPRDDSENVRTRRSDCNALRDWLGVDRYLSAPRVNVVQCFYNITALRNFWTVWRCNGNCVGGKELSIIFVMLNMNWKLRDIDKYFLR